MPGTFIASLTLSVIGYLVHDLYTGAIDVTKWYNLYMMHTPYNRFTTRGYFFYCIHETVTVLCLAAILAIFLSVFISPILFLEAFCVDFLQDFMQLNKLETNKRKNRTEQQQMLIDSVEFHKDIIGFVYTLQFALQRFIANSLNNFYLFCSSIFKQHQRIVSGLLFFQMLSGAILISTALFQLDIVIIN